MKRCTSVLVGFVCAVCTLNLGCNYKRMVINSSYLMVEEATFAFYEETDTQLAKEAAPANLKLVEGMARGAPDNVEVLLAASQLIGMYAFGFLEDSTDDENSQEMANARAARLYFRAFNYASAALQQRADFAHMMAMDISDFENALKEYDEEDVPGLFWAAFNFGLYINMSRADLSAIAQMSKVQAMAKRVIALDESYFYGGAHLILMVYNGVLGPTLGGSPAKTKKAYYRASSLSNETFLMTRYLYARYYCVQTQNRWLFEKLLKDILDAPDDLLASQALSNALAKEKAQRLLAKADDLF
ncbi:MAG: hypothetical protein JXR76_15575 [Deltaproteobacteria bacterium]|nr:hypothetical protein [Deltaproteobacteria bacterium]